MYDYNLLLLSCITIGFELLNYIMILIITIISNNWLLYYNQLRNFIDI